MRQHKKIEGSGQVFSDGKNLFVPKTLTPNATLQGCGVGGTPPPVTVGTQVLDPGAHDAYSIQNATFVLTSGQVTFSVAVAEWPDLTTGTAVSWLTDITLDASSGPVTVSFDLASPPPDQTNIVPVDGILLLVVSSSSNGAGFYFSLNVPF